MGHAPFLVPSCQEPPKVVVNPERLGKEDANKERQKGTGRKKNDEIIED